VPDARDLYGRTKLLGELAAPALTLRTSIIGWELERSIGLLGWFASQSGERLSGFTNAVFSGLTTTALARVIAVVIGKHRDLSGLYHVSAQPISKFDLLLALRDVLNLECDIQPVQEPQINRALDSARFRATTAIAIPSWGEMLEEYGRSQANVES